jgi:dipeptidyl aminopeptidase/acylaminoacyl peptidase
MICHAGIFNTLYMTLQLNSLGFNRNTGWHSSGMEALERCNPAQPSLLRNWKTPMLVIHNERDCTTPVSEGLATYNNLQSLDVPSKFLTFMNEDHDITKEENLLEWYRAVFAWVNRFTKMGADHEHTGYTTVT